jgi:lantibiotic modifying enzyme
MEKKQVYIITKEFMGLDYERQQRVTTTEEKAFAIKEEMVEEASAILKEDMMDGFDDEYNDKLDTEYRWYLYDGDYSVGAEVYIEILDVE